MYAICQRCEEQRAEVEIVQLYRHTLVIVSLSIDMRAPRELLLLHTYLNAEQSFDRRSQTC